MSESDALPIEPREGSACAAMSGPELLENGDELLAPLRRDFCCRKNMQWASALSPRISVEAFKQGLARHGFIPAAGGSPIVGLNIFDHTGTGHRVIHVARSGRIQIRLDPLTGHDDRANTAVELYQLLRLASRIAAELDSQTSVVETAQSA